MKRTIIESILNPFYRHEDLNLGTIFHARDNGGGGGGGRRSKRPEEDDEEEEKPRRPIRDTAVTVAKYNSDLNQMANRIGTLEDDNFDVREKNRLLKLDIKDLEKELPEEGGRVLTKAEAADYDAYVALGKPKDLEGLKQKNEDLEKNQLEIERDKTLTQVANAPEPGVKYDFDVFKDLTNRLVEPKFEKKKEKEDGVEVERWYVSYKEGTETKSASVTELYKTKFPKFVASLVTAEGEDDGDSNDGEEYPEQVEGEKQVDSKTNSRSSKIVDPDYDYILKEDN
jgi:hypothetical protein